MANMPKTRHATSSAIQLTNSSRAMRTIYVLGAGFLKSCAVATDAEMLKVLDDQMHATPNKDGTVTTVIQSLLHQNFEGNYVGFEHFMSTLAGLKFLPEFMRIDQNIFRKEEKAVMTALRKYLCHAAAQTDLASKDNPIGRFVEAVNWKEDLIITFNYDLLLERAAECRKIDAISKILHLHGSLADKTLVYPNFHKFAYRTKRDYFSARWKQAYDSLNAERERLARIVFIGYSLPPSDFEARSLFNYSDWYNFTSASENVYSPIPQDRRYSYEIIVVNPDARVVPNYSFFRKKITYHRLKIEDFVRVM